MDFEMTDTERAQRFIEMVEAFIAMYPESDGSFAHIVLGEFNFSDDDILSCLSWQERKKWRDTMEAQGMDYDEIRNLEDAIVGFLQMLLNAIPENIRVLADGLLDAEIDEINNSEITHGAR